MCSVFTVHCIFMWICQYLWLHLFICSALNVQLFNVYGTEEPAFFYPQRKRNEEGISKVLDKRQEIEEIFKCKQTTRLLTFRMEFFGSFIHRRWLSVITTLWRLFKFTQQLLLWMLLSHFNFVPYSNRLDYICWCVCVCVGWTFISRI